MLSRLRRMQPYNAGTLAFYGSQAVLWPLVGVLLALVPGDWSSRPVALQAIVGTVVGSAVMLVAIVIGRRTERVVARSNR